MKGSKVICVAVPGAVKPDFTGLNTGADPDKATSYTSKQPKRR